MKKIFVLFIISLLILLSFPSVESGKGKPDLEIIDIIFKTDDYGHHPIPYLSFYCRVKNIGDSTIDSEIDVTIHVFKCLLLFPVLYSKTFKIQSKTGSILVPGETMDIYIDEGPYFLILGIYWFFTKVNPEKTIDESNYDNNYYRERAFNYGIANGWIDIR